MRITVLAYQERGGAPDPVVQQVADALKRRDHDVRTLLVSDSVPELLDGLTRQRPELVFNLLEEFGGDANGNIAVCGILDLLQLRYTGSGAGEFYLGQDKALAKRILAFENILFPKFAVFSQDQGLETGGNLRLPLFVKPVALDASLGISGASIVRSASELMERVLAIHRECHDGALAEEFVEGREFYVGVLGNAQPLALPPIEADFSGLPDGAPKIYDRNAKWGVDSPEFRAMKTRLADVPDQLRARLQKTSIEAYRALRVRDYGRVDLRVSETGEIYVLEVNASCYLERGDEFARAAQAAGLEYDALVSRIVELACERYARPR